MRTFVFGAVHIIGLSPAPSSALAINVPSTFDTNIYTAHNARSETHPALRTPLPCASGKVAERSVRHGLHKDVVRRREEGNGKERKGGEEGGGERLLHLSQVRLGSQGCQSPFPSPRLGAKEAAGRKKNGRKSQ